MKKLSHKKIIFGYCSILSLVFIANSAQAQSPKSTTTQLPQVTVISNNQSEGAVDGYKAGSSTSALRTNTPLINTPQSVSVVTENQIRDQNITNMEEALRYVPGMNIQQGEGNRDQITIRGNSTTADFFIDGARDDAQYFRDFYNIDRVEFLKGPNAMAFGRGGSGGVVNRVSKFADGNRKSQLILSGGSFDNRRVQADLGDKISDKVYFRINGVYERSNSFRKFVNLERYGFAPTATFILGQNTDLKVGYEDFSDSRVNDRGLPSQNGGVYKTRPSTFFGNPNENTSNASVRSAFATFTHDFSSKLQLKNYTRFTKNSKFYQNVYVNGAVSSTGTVALAAYNDTTDRENFTNQTDITAKFKTGEVKHTALFGTEISNQDSENLRKTGFFNGSSTSATVSVNNPLNFDSVDYRYTSGNDNKTNVRVYGVYAQDQIEINKHLQLVGGLRYDSFQINLQNNRTNQDFQRNDHLISPRAGIVIKPQESVSLYGSYSVSYLPSAGDQFNSLTSQIQSLKPEKMENFEIGAKWDITPKINFTTAIYQLNRTNTRASDPNNTGLFILTGESRTNGVEIGITGQVTNQWQVIGGYAYQDAYILSGTSSAAAGKRAALVPVNRGSLWNKYDFTQKFSAAIGVITQSDQFATVDNTVRLKGFTRFDGALFYKINNSHRLQINAENIFDQGYAIAAHNNNNIQPGSPRAFKVSLVANF